MRPLNKIKMNRFLKVFGLLSIILFFASCKNDDDVKVVPPRDYGIQYASEKDSIEKYLKTHYITVDPVTMDATFGKLPATGKVSIWDQTEYPLKNKKVLVKNEKDSNKNVEYTLYYISFREGVNKRPTRADNVMVALKGLLLDGTQFEYQPYPDESNSLTAYVVKGFPELLPFFKSGTFTDVPGEPVEFSDYGAGVMFVPSGLSYYNKPPSNLVPAYATMIFTFKLYDVTYTDIDGDGILNKDETANGIDIQDYDTDGDGKPNYLDVDDDGDGRFTKDELRKANTTNEYYTYDEMFDEFGNMRPDEDSNGNKLLRYTCSLTATVPSYLDPTCKGGGGVK